LRRHDRVSQQLGSLWTGDARFQFVVPRVTNHFGARTGQRGVTDARRGTVIELKGFQNASQGDSDVRERATDAGSTWATHALDKLSGG
jgi:hypothetical protein